MTESLVLTPLLPIQLLVTPSDEEL